MSKYILRVTFVLLASVTQPLSASDVSDAIDAMKAGNFAEAYCVLRPNAEAGDPEAQYNIGWMYLNGYGLAMNDSLALEWWQRASDQGYTDASFSIAMLYSLGEGKVKKDMDKAIEYYLMAVEDGHEDANMIIRSMLARDDRAIRERKREIIRTYGYLIGPLFDVKVERANVRQQPSLEARVITVVEAGTTLVELSAKDKWMQVGVLESGEIAWIYNTLVQPHVMADRGLLR
jgi:SH3-like domain-containing protein